ncbi:MAG TPA: helix-turn-helix domain-containing protein [Thermoanaerobaculia bacterium]|nr:helix-turn-helix domain-containing protein [Thermoanaerobaculia bacterium]
MENAVPHLARCQACWDRAGRVISELRRQGLLARAVDERQAIIDLYEKGEAQSLRRLMARGRWAELRRLPVRQQLDRLKAEPELLTLEMFHTVAGEAELTSQEDPHLGEETAIVAAALAAALPKDRYPEPFRNDLQGEALAIVANCRRLAGDWRGAAAALGAAQGHLQRGTGDPVRDARLLSLKASLATDTGQLEQALKLLARTSTLYSEAKDTEAVAAVKVKEANTLLAAGRHEEAIARAEEALSGLRPGETRLALLARNVITASLVYLEHPAEALYNFLVSQPLIKQLPGLRTELQSGYLEALLLDSLGHDRESDKAFRYNITSWMEAELYKDAFLAMLTHFEILCRRDALERAARACEEALERIEQAGTGCHSQMTELWRDLLALVQARRLTEHQLLVARQYLVRHWAVPARHPPLESWPQISSVAYREDLKAVEVLPPLPVEVPSRPLPSGSPDLANGGYEEALERFDRELIAAALARSGGRVRETSRLLGISRNTLRTKIKHYGLVAGDPAPPPPAPEPLGEGEESQAHRWLRARAWWTELKTLPRGQQIERIRTVSTLQTRELFEVIAEEAASVAPSDPRQGQEMALLAHTLAGLLPRSSCPELARNDFQGAALLVVANCRRLAGDWQGSAAAFGAARSHLEQSSGEPARVARLLSLQASLATDMGHVDQALALLARAAALYRQAKDPVAVASVTVKEANTLLAAFRHEEAIDRAEEALRSLPPGAARLEVLARNVMIASLVYLGRTAEALRHLVAVEPLCRQLGGLRTELQSGYLEALLLDALGHAREASAAFQNTIARGMEAGLYKDAFLIMLTQFEFLFRRGALNRAASTCEEALDRLEEAGEDFHAPMKELWRALLTLVNARRLTESHLLEARHYLVRCGNLSEPRAARGAVAFALPVWAGGPAAPEVENAPIPASPAETAPAVPAPSPDPPTVAITPPDPATSLAEDGYKQALERYDRQLVAAGLAQCQGRLGETCRLLGISRTLLRAKLKRYFLTGSDAD